MSNLKKYFKDTSDNALALSTAILSAGFMVAVSIVLCGALLAATYLWQWPGFAFAIGAILTVIVACCVIGSDE